MQRLSAYLRLMRLHQPAGIWLLLWPCWWSIAMAGEGIPSPRLLALFALGAVAMRGAGCIVNDVADREFDRQVARTRTRPLASGELSLAQALLLLLLLLLIALVIALQLNAPALLMACAALPLVATYPWMKRITWWPQAFLGLTFNWGALMGWAAVRGALDWPALWLYLGGIAWTLGYDTLYAHQDKEDDARIGIKSTALRLGTATKRWVAWFYAAAVFCWGAAGWLAGETAAYFMVLGLAAGGFAWQLRSVDLANPGRCMAAFRDNVWLGGAIFLGVVAGKLF